MAELHPVDIVVVPLGRALLDGVDDGSGELHRDLDLVVLPCFEDERPLQGFAGLVDWRSCGALSVLLRDGFYGGAVGEAVLLPGRRTLPMKRIVLFGLGPSTAFDRAAAVATGERLVTLVERLGPQDVLVAMPGRVPDRATVEALFDGLVAALDARGPQVHAQPAVRAVGDDARSSVVVDGEFGSGSGSGSAVGGPDADAGATPSAMRAVDDTVVSLEVAPEPSGAESRSAETSGGPAAHAGAPERPGAGSDPARGIAAHRGARRWWVVADPRHEARLRRLLEGPPRAAEPGA